MDCLKKIKPVYWLVIAVVVVAILYLAGKHEHFSLSVFDNAGSLSVNCVDRPPFFNSNWNRSNWHRSNWHRMTVGNVSEVTTGRPFEAHHNMHEGVMQYITNLESCDPVNGGIFGGKF